MSQFTPPINPGQTMLRPHRAVAVLVLGILALVIGCIGWIFGIIAWVMGSADLREMEAGRMDPTGRSMTQAGKICGMIGTILWGAGFCIYVLIFLLGLAGAVVGARP